VASVRARRALNKTRIRNEDAHEHLLLFFNCFIQ
jgi:hypothetical protein